MSACGACAGKLWCSRQASAALFSTAGLVPDLPLAQTLSQEESLILDHSVAPHWFMHCVDHHGILHELAAGVGCHPPVTQLLGEDVTHTS